jgi:hypothetical protein
VESKNHGKSLADVEGRAREEPVQIAAFTAALIGPEIGVADRDVADDRSERAIGMSANNSGGSRTKYLSELIPKQITWPSFL